ncbi:hypothetical protein DR996_17280 [Vibrio owensii]|nr:hypothetical protein DR996_17280 [Vibrio owensii]
MRNAWHFHYALVLVFKVVCGSIGKDRKTATDEVKSTVEDESRKFLGGRDGVAVVGQFVEFKLIIAIGLPVVLFLGICSLVNSLLKVLFNL